MFVHISVVYVGGGGVTCAFLKDQEERNEKLSLTASTPTPSDPHISDRKLRLVKSLSFKRKMPLREPQAMV